MPTKEEWQYAARGGRHSKGYDYSGSDNLYEAAWVSGNCKGYKHEVGQLKPNELGLYEYLKGIMLIGMWIPMIAITAILTKAIISIY